MRCMQTVEGGRGRRAGQARCTTHGARLTASAAVASSGVSMPRGLCGAPTCDRSNSMKSDKYEQINSEPVFVRTPTHKHRFGIEKSNFTLEHYLLKMISSM